MLPFFLYLITAVLTGFHVYTLLTLTLLGAPVNPLELVSLLGSLALLIAAYISLFNPYIAARVALLACLAMWSFYAPAIAKSIRSGGGKPAAGSFLVLTPRDPAKRNAKF
jgi:hypothetical protein